MKKTLVMILIIAGCFTFSGTIRLFAQEQSDKKKTAAEDKVIAALLKTFAGAYVKTADINKLKEKQIQRLEAISEDDFTAAYERIFSVIRECPQCSKKFGLYDGMSKEELIARIISFDRKQICAVIDAIPDKVLSEKFRAYLAEKGQGSAGAGVTQQVTNVWARIQSRAEGR